MFVLNIYIIKSLMAFELKIPLISLIIHNLMVDPSAIFEPFVAFVFPVSFIVANY